MRSGSRPKHLEILAGSSANAAYALELEERIKKFLSEQHSDRGDACWCGIPDKTNCKARHYLEAPESVERSPVVTELEARIEAFVAYVRDQDTADSIWSILDEVDILHGKEEI